MSLFFFFLFKFLPPAKVVNLGSGELFYCRWKRECISKGGENSEWCLLTGFPGALLLPTGYYILSIVRRKC